MICIREEAPLPSLVELLLFLSCLAIVISVDSYIKNFAKRSSTPSKTSRKTSTTFSSHVSWFRDYWSERYKLGRNTNDERASSKSHFGGDIVTEVTGDDKCKVRDPAKNVYCYVGLINPYKFVRKYEPYGITMHFKGTQEKPDAKQLRSEGIGWTQKEVAQVDVEPIAQSDPASLGKAAIDLLTRYYLVPIATMLIWAASIILRFLIEFIPWTAILYWPLMLLCIISIIYSVRKTTIFPHVLEKAMEARAAIYLYNGEKPSEHYLTAADAAHWLRPKPYWVFRYIFVWQREITINRTFPFVHCPRDQERVELWLDAKTGAIEWIVSDYHYRELWYKARARYKAENDLDRVLVWIYPNFHTPQPLNIRINCKAQLRSLTLQGRKRDSWRKHVTMHTLFHPPAWVAIHMKATGLSRSKLNVMVKTLSNLWWDHWRYPLGTDNAKKERDKQQLPSVVGKEPPRPGQETLFGVITEHLSKERVSVECQDGRQRTCRTERIDELTPPSFFNVAGLSSEGSLVLVVPDKDQPEVEGEVIARYDDKETIQLLTSKRRVTKDLLAFYELFGAHALHKGGTYSDLWFKAHNTYGKGLDIAAKEEINDAIARGYMTNSYFKRLIYPWRRPLKPGDREKKISSYESAKPLFEQLNERHNVAHCDRGLGDTFHRSGEYDKALRHYELAKEIFERLRMQHNLEYVRKQIKEISEKKIAARHR